MPWKSTHKDSANGQVMPQVRHDNMGVAQIPHHFFNTSFRCETEFFVIVWRIENVISDIVE
jgi:hypothetical protein